MLEGKKIRLRYIKSFSKTEWLYCLSEEQYNKLLEAEKLRLECHVDVEAYEGYYDITLPCGTKIEAISDLHFKI